MTLVAVPELPSTNGIIHLRPVPTPFGVSVRPDGRPRYRLVATLDGLPDPRSLGDYTTCIAWGYTLSLDSAVKLGPVTNGVVSLGELNFVQFRILVTAERSTAVVRRGRRLVLRGTSPSARLMAHRDVMQPSAPGAMRDPTPAATSMPPSSSAMAMAMSHASPNAGHGTWVMPPMPAGSTGGMMGMDGMHPTASPFRPGAGVDPASLPLSRPRELVRLADGDTMHLESGLVRRTIGDRTFVMYGFNREHPGPLSTRPRVRPSSSASETESTNPAPSTGTECGWTTGSTVPSESRKTPFPRAARSRTSYAAAFGQLRRNADVEAELAPLRRLFDAPPARR